MGRSCARDHSPRTGKARPADCQRAAATPRVRCGRVDPWVTGLPDRLRQLRTVAPFHPNAAEMRAIADAVVQHLEA